MRKRDRTTERVKQTDIQTKRSCDRAHVERLRERHISPSHGETR